MAWASTLYESFTQYSSLCNRSLPRVSSNYSPEDNTTLKARTKGVSVMQDHDETVSNASANPCSAAVLLASASKCRTRGRIASRQRATSAV